MAEEYERKSSEEVTDIVENIPNNFNSWILGGILFILIGFFGIGYFVEYPDVIESKVVIKAEKSPIKIISISSGKLRLLKGRGTVEKGDYIGFIETIANFEDVIELKKNLFEISPESDTLNYKKIGLNQSANLGELEQPYYTFIDSYYIYYSDKTSNKYDLRINSLLKEISKYENLILVRRRLLKTKDEEFSMLVKRVEADSVLFAKNAILEFELNDTKLGYLRLKEEIDNTLIALENDKLNLSKINSEISNLHIEKEEGRERTRINMINSYRTLIAKINDWERNHAFKSPITGKLEYLEFWENGEFINIGEPLFSVLPYNNKFVGYVYTPSIGAGKVKEGQTVNIKLESYPYQEFGILKGKIESISLMPNESIYLNKIELPNNLISNIGQSLSFSAEMEGSAEIITENKRLLARLYGKMKYLFSE